MGKIYIIDVTNRDGVQTAKLGLSKLEKTMLNVYLNEMGVFQSEFGFPTTRHETNYLRANLELSRMGVLRPIRLEGWLRAVTGDVVKRRNPYLALSSLKSYVLYRMGFEKDPFDTFDFMMDLSERAGFKSNFNFMAGGKTKYDSHYSLQDSFIKRLMQKINRRGHVIGIHPSYDTYNDKKKWQREYEKLTSVSPQAIKTGRQHYLRFGIPMTWQIWEDHAMVYDNTLGYAEGQVKDESGKLIAHGTSTLMILPGEAPVADPPFPPKFLR